MTGVALRAAIALLACGCAGAPPADPPRRVDLQPAQEPDPLDRHPCRAEPDAARIDAKLRHPDPAIRQDGLSLVRFSSLGPESHHARIVELLDDPDAQVRFMAMRALEDFWRPESLPRLESRLRHDPDTFNREEAARQMPSFGPDLAVPALVRALSSEAVGNVRQRIVKALAAFRDDPGARTALEGALGDPEEIVRDEARRALSVP